LGIFEQQMKDMVEKITDFAQAQDVDIDGAFTKAATELEQELANTQNNAN
jgi:hypothetical protein